MSYNTARPHLAAFVVLRRGDKVAFVYRANTSWMNDYWGLPAGKIEKDEPVLRGAVREAKEEAGVTVKEEDLKHLITVHRANQGDHAPEWIDVYLEASSWEGEPFNAEPKSHSKLEWLDINNLPDNIVPPQKDALKKIAKGKTYSEFGW